MKLLSAFFLSAFGQDLEDVQFLPGTVRCCLLIITCCKLSSIILYFYKITFRVSIFQVFSRNDYIAIVSKYFFIGNRRNRKIFSRTSVWCIMMGLLFFLSVENVLRHRNFWNKFVWRKLDIFKQLSSWESQLQNTIRKFPNLNTIEN